MVVYGKSIQFNSIQFNISIFIVFTHADVYRLSLGVWWLLVLYAKSSDMPRFVTVMALNRDERTLEGLKV